MELLLEMRKILVLTIFCIAGIAEAANFKFAVLGDSQFDNPDVFEKLTPEVELLKPDLVIHIGDQIHGYTYDPEELNEEWARFKSQIAPITAPYYPVPGNHDVATTPMEAVYAKVWGADKFYYSFDHKGSHFAILDSDYRLKYGIITDDQLEWLAADLEANKNADNIFIFVHRPLWRDRNSNWLTVREILKKYDNIRAVFAGHTHEYCLEKIDNIPCFIVNSSGWMRYFAPAAGYFFQFLYVSVNGKEVTEAVIPAGSVKPADYVTRAERNRVAPYFTPPGGGQIPDPRNAPLDIVYSFPLKNRTREINVYTITWETPNPAFSVEPHQQAIMLAPGRTEDIYVRIKAPSREYKYYSLPYARIETYYTTLRGESIVLKSRHELCIPRQAVAKYTATPPWIDGFLDDTAWQSADVINGLQINKVGDEAKVQTWIRTLFDEEYFYIAVHCAEPYTQNLVAYATGPIHFTWGDDDIEIFLDTNHDIKTFIRAYVTSVGTTFNTLPGKGICPAWYKHAEHIGKDYWSIEFRMPLKTLGVEDMPTSATVWGFNVRRHRQKPHRVQSDWVKMQNFPYEPWRFGLLKFSRQ